MITATPVELADTTKGNITFNVANYRYWTKKLCIKDARKYGTLIKWRKSQLGYAAAINHSGPVLELCSNSDIKVKGRLVENDMQVVEGMRELLKRGQHAS